MFFDYSFEQWAKITGKTFAEWREESIRTWAMVRAAAHYHNGVPCEVFHAREEEARKAAAGCPRCMDGCVGDCSDECECDCHELGINLVRDV